MSCASLIGCGPLSHFGNSKLINHRGDRSIRERTAQQPRVGILIVDDEPLVRKSLELALPQQGFTVWLARNGNEAVQVYQQHCPEIAVVLLDVRMPGLDGPQTLAALQKVNPLLSVVS